MKCLKCKAEYEDGFTTCADCHVPLVADDYKEDAKPEKSNVSEESAHAVNATLPHALPFINHLETLGFTTSEEDKILIAKHPQFEALYLAEYEGGIIFEVWYSPTAYARENRQAYLEFINHFNNDVPVLRAADREAEKAFVLDTWIPALYDPERFDNFIRMFIAEITGVLYRYEDYSKFLEPYKKTT